MSVFLLQDQLRGWSRGNQFRDAGQIMIQPTGISYHVRIRAFGSAYFLPKISPYFGLDGRKLPLRKEGQFVFYSDSKSVENHQILWGV